MSIIAIIIFVNIEVHSFVIVLYCEVKCNLNYKFSLFCESITIFVLLIYCIFISSFLAITLLLFCILIRKCYILIFEVLIVLLLEFLLK